MRGSPAITRNRLALLAVAAAITALIGERGAGVGFIARGLRNAALALLRPAESALRRLIVVAAQGLVVAPASRPFMPGAFAEGATGASRLPAFRLLDPRKRFMLCRRNLPMPMGIPRIRTFWGPSVPATPPPIVRCEPQPFIDVSRLRLRIATLEKALNDLPGQARRLARWRARENARSEASSGIHVRRLPRQPLRPGQPPGFRRVPTSDVDGVLAECHTLALAALVPDTS